MASTTFSGPIKAGTIRNTTGTTVGTDVANVGYVVMSQAASVTATGATGSTTTIGTIPANSQVLYVILTVTTANDAATASTIKIGTSSDDDAFLAATSVQSTGTTFSGVMTTASLDVGTSDVAVIATFTSSGTDGSAGVAHATVVYAQNTNYA